MSGSIIHRNPQQSNARNRRCSWGNWGASEITKMRDGEVNGDQVRIAAYIFGAGAFVSYACRHSLVKASSVSHHAFWSSFRHAADSPWEAIATEVSNQSPTLLQIAYEASTS